MINSLTKVWNNKPKARSRNSLAFWRSFRWRQGQETVGVTWKLLPQIQGAIHSVPDHLDLRHPHLIRLKFPNFPQNTHQIDNNARVITEEAKWKNTNTNKLKLWISIFFFCVVTCCIICILSIPNKQEFLKNEAESNKSLWKKRKERENALSNLRLSKEDKDEDLNSVAKSLSTRANLANASAEAFLAAQSSLLKNSTKHGTRLFNTPRVDAPPAPIMLPMSDNNAGFALKLSLFANFSSLGRSFSSCSGSGSGAASIAAAMQSAEPICKL